MKLLLSLLAMLALAASASAQVPAGSGTLSGPETLKIQRCAKGRGNPSVAVVLNADGTFTIGASSSIGMKPRTFFGFGSSTSGGAPVPPFSTTAPFSPSFFLSSFLGTMFP